MKRTAFWAVLYLIYGIYFRLGRSEMICLVFFVFSIISVFWFVVKTKNTRYLLFLLFIFLGFLMAVLASGNPNHFPSGDSDQ